MRVERRVDGFVAERGGLRIDGTTATALALGGMLVALAMPACFGTLGIPVGLIIVSTACAPGISLLGGTRMQALKVEVVQPRVHCTVGTQSRSVVIARGAVSVGPETIDVDEIDGDALRIPTAGLSKRQIEELVALLREAAAGEAGSAEEVPEALREVQRERAD